MFSSIYIKKIFAYMSPLHIIHFFSHSSCYDPTLNAYMSLKFLSKQGFTVSHRVNTAPSRKEVTRSNKCELTKEVKDWQLKTCLNPSSFTI